MPVSESAMFLRLINGLLGATVLGRFLGRIGIGVKRSKKILKCRQVDKVLIEERIVKAIETMQLGVTITDLEGKILYTNPAEAKMHGYTVEELIGKDLEVFVPPKLRKPMTAEQIKQIKHLRESINIRKDGKIFPVRLMSDIVKDAAGKPAVIVTTCEDISEHQRADKKLQQHARELTLLNHMSDLLQACENEGETYKVIVDVCKKLFPSDSGCLCILNPSKARMEVVDFWGEPPRSSMISPSDSSMSIQNPGSQLNCADFAVLCPHQIYYPYHECLSAPIVASGEILGLLSLCFIQRSPDDPDNEYYEQIESKQMVLDRIAEHYALSLANLRLREKLKIEAIRDPLTGLYNRRYMKDALEREAHRAGRHNTSVGIIMLDIDHFKNFNDNYGHKAGDVVLRELGAFLLTHIRGEDIACRYGGEEFLLILPETTLEISTQRAEELRIGLKKHRVRYQGRAFQITASFGVAALPNHGPEMMHAVNQSDIALYQAKARGRDQVVVATEEKSEYRNSKNELKFKVS